MAGAAGGAVMAGGAQRPRAQPRPRQNGASQYRRGGGRGGRPPRDDGPSLAQVFTVVIVLFLLIVIFSPTTEGFRKYVGDLAGMGDDLRPKKTIKYPEALEFQTQRRITINPSGGQVSSWEYRAVAPRDIPSGGEIQDVISVGVSPMPNEGYPNVDDPATSDTIMTFDGVNLAYPQEIVIDYHIISYTHDWDVYSPSEYGTVEDIDQSYVDRYVKQEWVIDDDRDGEADNPDDGFGNTIGYRIDPLNPEIQRLAHELADGKKTAYGKAKAFYNYLHSNIAYPTSSQMEVDGQRYNFLPKYCTGPLADGRGDCDDQSITFISLCRAVGIPAWLELGYLFEQSSQKWGGHGWANVFLPLPDSERGYMIAPVDVVNSQFLFRGAYRFTDAVDNGDEGYLSYFYNTFSYTYTSSGGRAYFDDEFITGDISETGTIIREVPDDTTYTSGGILGTDDGEGGSTPGFSGALSVAAVAATVVSLIVLPAIARPGHRRRR